MLSNDMSKVKDKVARKQQEAVTAHVMTEMVRGWDTPTAEEAEEAERRQQYIKNKANTIKQAHINAIQQQLHQQSYKIYSADADEYIRQQMMNSNKL